MSSNIPLMNPIEDKIQDKDMAQDKVPSLDKSGYASKTETEHTEKLHTNKLSPSLRETLVSRVWESCVLSFVPPL